MSQLLQLDRQMDRQKENVLGLYRIVVGLLFTCHGLATLFGVLVPPHGGHTPSPGQWPSWWAALIQLLGGVFVLMGFGTRAAAMICSGSMAFAYFSKHQPHDLLPIQNGGEPAVMFCWAFLLLMFFGPGSWALSPALGRVLRPGRVRDDGAAVTPAPAGRG